ncbi:MAG: site-2 protease family protein [Sedimentisphaerales bacterium]
MSEIEEAFCKSYYSDKIFYCPTCWEKNATQQGKSYLTACIIVLIIGIIWVIISPQNELAWLILQAGLSGCFITAIVAIPHELGHVLTAFLIKAKILQVTIGLGRILYNRDFWGIEWKFCAIPICGFSIIGLKSRRFYRLRSFLITLGGPLVNFLLIFVAMILLFNISLPWLLAVVRSFLIANIFVLLFNLMPRKANFAGTITPSDGLALLTTPFMSQSKINQEIEACYVWEGYSYYTRGRIEDAKRSYERGLEHFPNSFAIQNEMGRVLLHLGKYVEARNLFVELQKNTNLGPAMNIGILNAIATADVMIGENALLAEADAFSKTACENMPWQTEFKWTHGLVLVQKGHIEQGLILLKEAMDKMENSFHKAVYASYISEVENKKGNAV